MTSLLFVFVLYIFKAVFMHSWFSLYSYLADIFTDLICRVSSVSLQYFNESLCSFSASSVHLAHTQVAYNSACPSFLVHFPQTSFIFYPATSVPCFEWSSVCRYPSTPSLGIFPRTPRVNLPTPRCLMIRLVCTSGFTQNGTSNCQTWLHVYH